MKTFFASLALIGLLVPASAQGVRLVISNASQSDTVHLYFQPGASTGYDNTTDVTRNPQTGNGHNYIFSDANGTALRINYVPQPDSSYIIPVGVFIQAPGNVDFLLEAEASYPAGTQFVLETSNGPLTLTPGTPVQQYLLTNNLTDPPAYVLHVFPAPVISSTGTTCTESTDGTLHVSFGQSGQWTLNVYDSGSTLLYSMPVGGNDTTVTNLQADNYTLGFGSPEFYMEIATVHPPAPLDASFTLPGDTLYTGVAVPLTNTATPGQSYSWDFGDGSQQLSGAQPTYVYPFAGSYIITQTVTTAAGCTTSFGTKVEVVPGLTTGIENTNSTDPFSCVSHDGQVTIHPQSNAAFRADIYSIDGRLAETLVSNGGDVSTTLPVNTIYVLRTQVREGSSFVKTIYVNGN